jgi:hypothetical protein
VRIPASAAAAVAALGRIEEALSGASLGAALEHLDRRGRPIAAWLAEVRALAKASGGYRAALVAREDLFALVKDGAAPVERRIAAAVALSPARDPATREALHAAADTCADPKLRVVLDHAADTELGEEQVEEAVRNPAGRA